MKGLTTLAIAKWKLAVAATMGLLVIVAFIVGYFAWGSRQETRAGVLLFTGVSQLEAGSRTGEDGTKQEEGVRLLQEVVTRYPRTAAAAEATLRLGTLYYSVGNYDEARHVYATHLATNPRGRIAFSAAIGVADTYVAQRNYEKAVETYAQLIQQFPEAPLLPEAHLHLARTYLQMSRFKDAIAVYEKVASAYPNTGWAQIAQAELYKLTSR